jgi:hypothetical protein
VAPRASRLLAPLLIGLLAAFVLARMTLLTQAFTDYELEAEPAFGALRAGHVGGFLQALPAYGGSLILRAPFALLPGLWHGGGLAVFRAVAVPALVATVAFGVVLWSHLAGERRWGGPAAWLALALVVFNPLSQSALETGHSEELLGAVLCAAAVVAALRDRPLAAGVLLGLAMANKPWAILAVVPVVAALRGGRLKALVVAGGVTAIVLAPMVLYGGAAGRAHSVATDSGTIFQPWQLWWFSGHHGEIVRGLYGVKAGYRASPGWISSVGHPIVVLIPLALSAVVLLVRGRACRRDALLLLALALLLRCLLDPWDASYYHLPFLLALTAHEAFARRRAPVAALLASAAAYLTIVGVQGHVSPDVSAAMYLAWSAPLALALSVRLFAPAAFAQAVRPLLAGAARQLPSLAPLVSQPERSWEPVPGPSAVAR